MGDVKVTLRNMNEDKIINTYQSHSNIEILEDKIIKFNNTHIDKIMEIIKDKYTDIDFFIRKNNNDLHIVKYNETLKIDINSLVKELFKYYSNKNEFKKIIEGIKLKGNNKFVIIENIKIQDKFITDITTLLKKQLI